MVEVIDVDRLGAVVVIIEKFRAHFVTMQLKFLIQLYFADVLFYFVITWRVKWRISMSVLDNEDD